MSHQARFREGFGQQGTCLGRGSKSAGGRPRSGSNQPPHSGRGALNTSIGLAGKAARGHVQGLTRNINCIREGCCLQSTGSSRRICQKVSRFSKQLGHLLGGAASGHWPDSSHWQTQPLRGQGGEDRGDRRGPSQGPEQKRGFRHSSKPKPRHPHGLTTPLLGPSRHRRERPTRTHS